MKYVFVEHPQAIVGHRPIGEENVHHGLAQGQHGPKGDLLFLHSNMRKITPGLLEVNAIDRCCTRHHQYFDGRGVVMLSGI